MPTYFVFSDESGEYKRDRTDTFIRAHPYYCRCSIILNSDYWKPLRDEFRCLKKSFLNIEPSQEVKWSYIWSIFKHKKNHERIPDTKPYYFLKDHSPKGLVTFVEKSLKLLGQIEDCFLIFTITLNDTQKTENIQELRLLSMHLQDMMQRVEMQIQSIPNSIGILLFERKEQKLDDKLKEAYHSIYQEGDFIKKYNHIMDSLLLDFSHHSFGIQLADYCASIFDSSLRGHQEAVDLLKSRIWHRIRRQGKDIFGVGICEVPTNTKNREWLKKQINKMIS